MADSKLPSAEDVAEEAINAPDDRLGVTPLWGGLMDSQREKVIAVIEADRDAVRADEQKRMTLELKTQLALEQLELEAVKVERERVLDAVRERILSEPEMAETREERLGATLGSNILISMVQPHLDAIRKGEG
jgi:hypothetical protein